jgi:hypothetical protein
LILGLLANTTVYGLILSVGLASLLFIDFVRPAGGKLQSSQKPASGVAPVALPARSNRELGRFALAFLAYILLASLAAYQIVPAKDNTFPAQLTHNWFDRDRWLYVFSRLFTTSFYIPSPHSIHFWNTNIFFSDSMKVDGAPPVWQWLNDTPSLSLVFLIMPSLLLGSGLMVFLRKPIVLLFYLATTAAFLALYYFTLLVQMRYCGHLLVVLILSFWLSPCFPELQFKNRFLSVLAGFGDRFKKPFLILLLSIQVIGAAVAWTKDWQHKFSVSGDVAGYIRREGLEQTDFAGMTDFVISPLSSYFNKKIFYFQRMEFGSFTRWDGRRKQEITPAEFLEATASLMTQRTNLVLILSEPLTIPVNGKPFRAERFRLSDDIKADLLVSFPPGIIEDERYDLYLVRKIDPSKEGHAGYTLLRAK